MSPISKFVMAAAKHTVKGAAVTLSSTVVACGFACLIEKGGHRLVYKYFPEKYATVEYANGLTQDQLDAVRVFKQEIATVQQDEQAATPTGVVAKEEIENKNDGTFMMNRFWNDMPSTKEIVEETIFVIPRQEIIACSMTG